MIDRRNFLAQSAGGAALLAQRPAPAGPRPNILHIMSDQHQWACIANRGLCNTPNLNRLVKEGMLFERSYTPSAVCCPARAMILSGAYHWHNGVFNQIHSAPSVHRDMFPDVVLYSNRLKDAGYRMGYTGKWHASWTRCPADFGYEMAGVGGCDPAVLRKYDLNPDKVEQRKGQLRRHPLKMVQWPGDRPVAEWGYSEGAEEQTHAWEVAEMAIRMMGRFAKDTKPWILETHFVDPHDPYFPLKKYLDRYDPKSIPVPESFRDTFAGKPGMHARESSIWGDMSEDDYRQSRACYYASIEQLDTQIGRLLDALDHTGQVQNTMVVFTTDHGDMCGNHKMWIKGWIPYEETYRIPMVIRWPGHIQAGSVSKHLVQTHDLGHTYAAAAGAKPLPYADGSVLQPLFANPATPAWTDQIMCAYYGGEFLYTQRIAITQRFKYVFNGFDIDELYDLEHDPEEMHNAIADPAYSKYTDDMRARLYEMMNQFEDPYGTPTKWTLPGQKPDRYGAPRYLPRGRRLRP
ncbi:MAG: sulfatase-like hydrolase/transferase [Acidobacteriota bacterium]|nr:sulfatase-like hydrolase/transferase [Acidobacteriota bacterium]